jgi:hypothetical protein
MHTDFWYIGGRLDCTCTGSMVHESSELSIDMFDPHKGCKDYFTGCIYSKLMHSLNDIEDPEVTTMQDYSSLVHV